MNQFPLKFNSTVTLLSLFFARALRKKKKIHTSFFSLLPFHQHHEDYDRTHRRLGRLRHRSPCLPIGTTTLSHLPALTLFSCVFLFVFLSHGFPNTQLRITPPHRHQSINAYLSLCACLCSEIDNRSLHADPHSDPFQPLQHTPPHHSQNTSHRARMLSERRLRMLSRMDKRCVVLCLLLERFISPPLLFDLFDLTLLYFLVCRLLPLM